MPEVVSTDPTTGLLSIGYSALVPAVVGAMQQMQAEITTLQGGIDGNASTRNLAVYNPSNFSGDSVGEAEIPAGQTSVRVSFSQPYIYQPVVTFSPEGEFVPAFIAEKDSAGFTLALKSATTTAVIFDWHGFASPTEQLTVSGGTQRIALAVAASAPTSEPQMTAISEAPDSSATPETDLDSSTSTPVLGTSTASSTQVAQSSTPTSPSLATSSVPSVVTLPPPPAVPTPVPETVDSTLAPAPSAGSTPSPAATVPPIDADTSADAGSGPSAQN
jgi:hypothetical protein